MRGGATHPLNAPLGTALAKRTQNSVYPRYFCCRGIIGVFATPTMLKIALLLRKWPNPRSSTVLSMTCSCSVGPSPSPHPQRKQEPLRQHPAPHPHHPHTNLLPDAHPRIVHIYFHQSHFPRSQSIHALQDLTFLPLRHPKIPRSSHQHPYYPHPSPPPFLPIHHSPIIPIAITTAKRVRSRAIMSDPRRTHQSFPIHQNVLPRTSPLVARSYPLGLLSGRCWCGTC